MKRDVYGTVGRGPPEVQRRVLEWCLSDAVKVQAQGNSASLPGRVAGHSETPLRPICSRYRPGLFQGVPWAPTLPHSRECLSVESLVPYSSRYLPVRNRPTVLLYPGPLAT